MKAKLHFIPALFLTLPLVFLSNRATAAVKGTYLYNLSNFTGAIPYQSAKIFTDNENREIYVSNWGEQSVRIFNDSGMEVYQFGDDEALASILDGQIEKDGSILLLSYTRGENRAKYLLIHCNYRGEAKSEIEIQNFPAGFSDVEPSRMIMRGGNLYLADINRMKVVVTDINGVFKEGYDLASILELTEQQRADSGLGGFTVDKEGNLFFTVPVFFSAYKVSPDRQLSFFGKKGSGPGKFSVISGIVTDDKGYIYVADKLRCVVMIFDKEFNFQNEFGYRGLRPGRLIVPMDLEIDGKNRLYVTQMRKRGISVFQITDQ